VSVSRVADIVSDVIQPAAVNHDLIKLKLFWELCLATGSYWLRRCVYVCACACVGEASGVIRTESVFLIHLFNIASSSFVCLCLQKVGRLDSVE